MRKTRREILAGTLGGWAGITIGSALPLSSNLHISRALAATYLTGVEWGGAYAESMKQVTSKQSKFEINWVLHQGGAAAILPKIKSAWPNAPFDFVAAWNPVFQAMRREGWMQPFTYGEVPNLKDVPNSLIFKDQEGKPLVIPRSLSGSYWYYREDTCPIQITKLEDLLSPKLKGQIIIPNPTLVTNMAMVTLALHRGGDERNLEPGWEFVKELAKSGNIGRVATADIDLNNSISSGETSVGYGASGIPKQLSDAGLKIRHLSKMPKDSGLIAILYTEGWSVLKGGKTAESLEFLNHCMSPEMNTLLNAIQGQLPTNSKSKPTPGLEHLVFTEEELKNQTYIPDWEYVSQQVDPWMKRWEKEVTPLL